MLRPFGDTTLTDIVLAKLAQLHCFTFFAGDEDEFRVKCEQHKVRFVKRDERSARVDEPISEILSFLRDVECEHLLLVNACLPFLRVITIQSFLDDCVAGGYQPAFSVIKRSDYFMKLDRSTINFDPTVKTINTKTVEPIYQFSHALYFFNRNYFLRYGTYWDWQTVRLVELPDGLELLDIDSAEDFILAEALWKVRDHVRVAESTHMSPTKVWHVATEG